MCCCFFIHSYVRVYLFLLVFCCCRLCWLSFYSHRVYILRCAIVLCGVLNACFCLGFSCFSFHLIYIFFPFTFFFSFILCVGCCWIHLKEHKITCARLLPLLLLLLLFNRSFHRRITTISIKIILCVCACSCSPNKNSVQFLSMARGLNTCGILQTIVTEMVLRVS